MPLKDPERKKGHESEKTSRVDFSPMRRKSLRRSQKIERVTDALIRSRIEKIKPKSVRTCTKYLYVIDGRVSEAVSRAYPSDR